MLTYCFESSHIPRTLAKCRKNDLAVVDAHGQILENRSFETMYEGGINGTPLLL